MNGIWTERGSATSFPFTPGVHRDAARPFSLMNSGQGAVTSPRLTEGGCHRAAVWMDKPCPRIDCKSAFMCSKVL